MPEVFGKGKAQRSLMYGYVTPTLILIETWTSSRYTSSTRTTRRDRTFTPLVFTTTGGMGEECKRLHNRLAELVAAKKGED